MNININWFFASIVFYWAYGLAAKKLEAPLLQRKWTQKHVNIAWLLMFVGCCFIVCMSSLAFDMIDKEKIVSSLFIWFCAHGIFAVMVARIVIGLLKCVREYRAIRSTE
jgi:hypothetical protein